MHVTKFGAVIASPTPSTVNDDITIPQLAESESPRSDENSFPVAATDSLPIVEHSPPVVTDAPTPKANEPRRIRQEDLFIVTDEMGRRLSAPPTPKPKGLFEVRDEMGQLINTEPKTKPETMWTNVTTKRKQVETKGDIQASSNFCRY